MRLFLALYIQNYLEIAREREIMTFEENADDIQAKPFDNEENAGNISDRVESKLNNTNQVGRDSQDPRFNIHNMTNNNNNNNNTIKLNELRWDSKGELIDSP